MVELVGEYSGIYGTTPFYEDVQSEIRVECIFSFSDAQKIRKRFGLRSLVNGQLFERPLLQCKFKTKHAGLDSSQ